MTVALVILGVFVVAGALAPWLAPFDPRAQPDLLAMRSQPPSWAHPFGTDPFSRDVFSRVLHGARVSLSVALLAALLSVTVGAAWGAIAGAAGGVVDTIMMRIVDAALAVPRVLVLLLVVALWGTLGVPSLILLLGLTGWFGTSRIIRAEVLVARERAFVHAAHALGATRARVLWHHVAPHVVAPLLVAATLGVAHTIVLEAGLSFIGVGLAPPSPSWGTILADGLADIRGLWWLSVFPGAAIVATVLAVNVVADGLRESMDPRQLPPR